MTDLADLGNFQHCLIADLKHRAQGQTTEVEPAGGQVFGEIARPHVKTGGAHLGDAFHAEQTYLTMPVTAMAVGLQAKTSDQAALADILLTLALAGAGADGNDFPLLHPTGS